MATTHAQAMGVEFDIDGDALDDWDVLGWLVEAGEGNIGSAHKFADAAFGKEQMARITRELPDKRIVTVLRFLNEAVAAAGAAKGGDLKN